ncbi:MAG: nitrous oxide reductase accessory protein NosL [Thermodesulfobacteriota bacterium]
MKLGRLFGHGAALLFFFAAIWTAPASAQPLEKIDNTARCAVCGMFVAKYPNWVTQIRDSAGNVRLFDGFKDLLAYYFDPGAFGGDSKLTAEEIWVKDYYTLAWLDGRKAYYVVGSDVYGPMGEEFVPFQDKSAAESFLKDHHGQKLLSFPDITREMVDAMRSHHKMQGHKMQ